MKNDDHIRHEQAKRVYHIALKDKPSSPEYPHTRAALDVELRRERKRIVDAFEDVADDRHGADFSALHAALFALIAKLRGEP
jgi:hypothetical protein